MKKTVGWVAVAALAMLASCQQVPENDVESRAMVKLSVEATTLPRSEVSGWGEGADENLEMNGVQVKSRAETEAATRMAFYLLDEDGEKVLSQEKDNSDDEYMNLYAEVPVGTYQLVAFAHNGSSDVSMDENAVITPEGKLTDSFIYYKELTLDEESDNSQSIVLDRCVAKFSLVHTDAIPTEAASVEIKVTGAAKVLNAKTGLGKEAADYTVTINIPSTAIGTKNNQFSVFVFLTDIESTVGVTAASKDADGNTITSYTFEDVEMEVNMQTIYTGAFFHSDQNIGATINSEWKENNEQTF